MLFILAMAMGPLQQTLYKATEGGLLTPIGANPIRMRTRLYANGATLHIRPCAHDLMNLQQILHTRTFGESNMTANKLLQSEMYAINCNVDGKNIADSFRRKTGGYTSTQRRDIHNCR
jgi:hypothetical protein